MDRKTRKVMTINKCDADRVYVPRNRSRRGLIEYKIYVVNEKNSLELYIKQWSKSLLAAVKMRCTDKHVRNEMNQKE